MASDAGDEISSRLKRGDSLVGATHSPRVKRQLLKSFAFLFSSTPDSFKLCTFIKGPEENSLTRSASKDPVDMNLLRGEVA
ncbi:hypothetical protein AVEN_253195-1 [Araneus ventricosus]|uniref:Uncharacterized protein n=1 Tax=Araneus ventricosus TaxID=182803 RepID=A0A4Y2PQZ5_ARAVE|nr:hypothetical protein AVEN_250100-1 [Araneus ventricosus]GBN53625.1 hypothetical protein AVEN_253195-1 [Araneus ventricosus]